MKLTPVLITEDNNLMQFHIFFSHFTHFSVHLSFTAVSSYYETQILTLISSVALYQHLTSLNRGHLNYVFSLYEENYFNQRSLEIRVTQIWDLTFIFVPFSSKFLLKSNILQRHDLWIMKSFHFHKHALNRIPCPCYYPVLQCYS